MLRAESLASGKFRRDKFWPRRYRCERGILEVLEDFNIADQDDFPDIKSESSEGDSSENASRWLSIICEREGDQSYLDAN